jgi:hypothetical protein
MENCTVAGWNWGKYVLSFTLKWYAIQLKPNMVYLEKQIFENRINVYSSFPYSRQITI